MLAHSGMDISQKHWNVFGDEPNSLWDLKFWTRLLGCAHAPVPLKHYQYNSSKVSVSNARQRESNTHMAMCTRSYTSTAIDTLVSSTIGPGGHLWRLYAQLDHTDGVTRYLAHHNKPQHLLFSLGKQGYSLWSRDWGARQDGQQIFLH